MNSCSLGKESFFNKATELNKFKHPRTQLYNYGQSIILTVGNIKTTTYANKSKTKVKVVVFQIGNIIYVRLYPVHVTRVKCNEEMNK